MNKVHALSLVLLLQGCLATSPDIEQPDQPVDWITNKENQAVVETDVSTLQSWWKRFDDPVLDKLINIALDNNPDRDIAKARISESRGLQRTQRSFLFPQVDVSASTGREDTGINNADSFYDAGFDASFELDIFGENRQRVDASNYATDAAEYNYRDITLTLIGEVSRTYTRVREFQQQITIAEKNLKIQLDTLELIRNQFSVGEVPQLDVERSENLVNTTKASIPEFRRLATNAKLQLITLTGILPERLENILLTKENIPAADVKPVLLSPANVLFIRPDIRAAFSQLQSNIALTQAEQASIFPAFNLGAFYGVTDSAALNSTTIWNVFIGGAFALLDFGRIEGRVDAAKAVEAQAYQTYRKAVLNAIQEVETAMNDYSEISNRRVSLYNAYRNADKALQLSAELFGEGEISFLDVLDSQRTANQADSELVTAEAAQTESLIRLYKSLGVY